MKLNLEWTHSAKLVVGFLLALLILEGMAFGQAPFYQGKTITLVRGSAPGGIGECGSGLWCRI